MVYKFWRTKQMKLIRYTIWALLAFVVIAALDSQPDPPALNPGTSLCKVLQHNDAFSTATQRCDSLTTPSLFPVNWLAADTRETHHPSDRLILTVQAADPSPPLPQANCKPSFQS
jgi:hypothetical protein